MQRALAQREEDMRRSKCFISGFTTAILSLMLVVPQFAYPVKAEAYAQSSDHIPGQMPRDRRYARSDRDCGPGERFVPWGLVQIFLHLESAVFSGSRGTCEPIRNFNYAACRSVVVSSYYVGLTGLTLTGTGMVVRAATVGARAVAAASTAAKAKKAAEIQINLTIRGSAIGTGTVSTHYLLSIPAELVGSSGTASWVADSVCSRMGRFWEDFYFAI